ncbi:MAG: ATP-binding protein, partial [Chloroflexi bacterium]|nr:ATP-binding protein [Chloroflexota bacterium]
MPERRLIVSGRYDRVKEVCDFVVRAAEEAGFDESEAFQCQLAVDEACANIIEHAYGGEDQGDIAVACEVSDGELRITLRDSGLPFDPQSVPDPPPITSLDDARIGGLGLAFMRKVMNSMSYSSDG